MTGSRVKYFRWLMGSVVLLTATAFGSMKLAAQNELPKVQAIAAQPAVVQVVTAANTTQANWTKAQITQYGRDWRKQFAANQGALLAAVKNNPATQALTQAQQNSAGLYNELTLFSQQGVIVADTQVGKQYRNASKVLWNQAFLANGSYVSGVKNDRAVVRVKNGKHEAYVSDGECVRHKAGVAFVS